MNRSLGCLYYLRLWSDVNYIPRKACNGMFLINDSTLGGYVPNGYISGDRSFAIETIKSRPSQVCMNTGKVLIKSQSTVFVCKQK